MIKGETSKEEDFTSTYNKVHQVELKQHFRYHSHNFNLGALKRDPESRKEN